EYRGDVREVLEDLKPDRPVARDHPELAERMDEHHVLQWLVEAGDADLPDFVPGKLHDLRAEAPDSRQLGLRRGVGHDDGAGNAEAPRMPREGLRHVPRAARVHASFPVGRGEEGDRVSGAADLERSGGLEVLELEVDLRR